MVLGAAQRMGGCGDAFFTALVLPAVVFSSPNIFPLPLLLLCTFLYHLSNCPPLLRDFSVTLWTCNSHWPISIRSWGERGR
jgi:hypothetical protein